MVWSKIQLHSLECDHPDVFTSFLKKTFFTPLNGLDILVKIRWSQTYDFISGFSVLLHRSICVFLCQNHTTLNTVAFQSVLKSWNVKTPIWFFQDYFGLFFKIISRGTFSSTYILELTLPSGIQKKFSGILIRITLYL